ncbi:MAG: hypothetical protein P4L77_10625 [Sulfuriferula sp.]|nr:hypothetical protein [Sulfuriferula sp.]
MEKDKLSYAVEQRLRFIDFLIAQYGHINRSAVADYYGVSVQQASHDLTQYQELAPKNIAYDLKKKTYVRTDSFERLWK